MSLVGVVTLVTSSITGAVVSVVVVELSVEVELSSSEVVSLSVVVEVVEKPPSLLLLQEMMVRLKRNIERKMSICLTRFPISGLGKPKLYQNMWCFTRKWDFTWKYDVEGKFTGKKEKGCQQTSLQILY